MSEDKTQAEASSGEEATAKTAAKKPAAKKATAKKTTAKKTATAKKTTAKTAAPKTAAPKAAAPKAAAKKTTTRKPRRAAGTNVENRQFQAETRQLLNLMIHSLYTHKEIFLRELISNASDALDKIRFRSLTEEALLDKDDSLEVWLSIDKNNNTFTISDNGIGMSREEVVSNIGTIARSGSKAFINALQEKNAKDGGDGDVDLIGQFGVGFYSSFMVADKVEVVTRGAASDMGVRWESAGEGEYTLEDLKVSKRGTTVTLHLREDVLNPSDPAEDYLNQYTIQNLVKKYSDFINYPVKTNFEKEDYGTDEDGKPKEPKKEIEVRTLNSMLPLWERNKNDVKEDEYFQFFKHHFHDWNEPTEIIHAKIEGSVQYTTLLYIPSQAPMNLYAADYKKGLQLYAKHVFVRDNCEDLLPDHLRFVKGLVDSPDFSLNISREILQHDRQIKVIAKNLEKKVMDTLKKMLKNEREKYEKWWEEFGKAIKGGIYMHYTNKEKLQDMLLFNSSVSEKMTTLKEYVERMPEWQTEIYYEVGNDRAAIERLPQMEMIREKGVEVLYFFDKVDEFLTQNLSDYDDKKLKSVSRGDLDLDGKKDDKDKDDEKKDDEKKEDSPHKEMLDKIQEHLGEKVKEVRISKRLKTSPVCLVSSDSGVSFNMEMLLKDANQSMGKAARIMELNEEHATFKIMQTAFEKDKESVVVKDFAELFYSQALLIEGMSLENPVDFATRLSNLMVAAHQ